MVRALLDGRKSQTRRLINPQPPACVTSAGVISRSSEGQTDEWSWLSGDPKDIDTWGFEGEFSTRFVPGDRLYVREEYYQRGHWAPVEGVATKGGRQKWAFVPVDDEIRFDAPGIFRLGRHSADPATVAWHKRLGRFMPRAASRMTLLVEDVRVERLQNISEADCWAEGVCTAVESSGRAAFGESCTPEMRRMIVETIHGSGSAAYHWLWSSLHTHEGQRWDDNPFVVAITFSVVRGNVDQVAA